MSSKQLIVLSQMSVNRKGDKLIFESAPAISYKTGLKVGEKTRPHGISDLYYYCCCCCCCYKAIKRKHFQLPTIEDITTRMANAKWFTKLDANGGY